MKLTLLTLIFPFITGLAYAQHPGFNLRYSEPLAVFVFAKNLTKTYGDNPFRAAFQKSVYNQQKYNDLIAEFDTLRIDYVYPFTEYPYGSKIPGMTEAILKKNLIAAKDITDFKMRSVGIIPNNTLSRLEKILSAFTPVYNDLIFLPNKEKFEKQLSTISTFANTKNIAGYFEEGLTFYHSVWDPSIPFEIVFYPLPDSEGFTAEAFYNHAVSAIQTDLSDYNILLSVLMHEIFHILFDEQPLSVKSELEVYVMQHPSKMSRYAYLLLNEVLATAVGNGYVYERLNGKPDSADWYNWPYINRMAKQIYPTVLEYIKQKKHIDNPFMDTYIRQYEQNFSGWINEPDHTMTYRYILSENQSDFRLIRSLYPYCSISEAEDQINETSIAKMKATPITKMIIVSGNHNSRLSLIKKSFPELQTWTYDPNKEFLYNILLKDKTQLYIINRHQTPTETFLKDLKKPMK